MQRSTNGGRPGFDGRQDEGAGGLSGIRPYVGAVQQLGAAHPHRNGPRSKHGGGLGQFKEGLAEADII